MSQLGHITAGSLAGLNQRQESTGVLVEVTSAHPTPEQVVDALLEKLELSETDRAALRQANGGKDIRQQLIADLRRSGLNSAALSYVGNGKYRGYVGVSKQMQQRLIEWSRTDGRAPARIITGTSTRQQELQAQGALMRHRAELALRKQEAKQQLVADVLGTGGAQMAGMALTRHLPKAAPLIPEALPPLLLGLGMVGSMAVVLDKGLELCVEQQMEAIRRAPPMMSEKQDERAPADRAQPQPGAPAIPTDDELPKGELVPAGETPMSTPQTEVKPTTAQPTAPQDKPPRFDPKKIVPPIIAGAGGAATGTFAEHMAGTSTTHVDLTAHEAKGGHLIAKHINQTDAQLAQRLVDEPKIPAATTWTDLPIAEKVTSDVIAANQTIIHQWVANPRSAPTLRLRYNGQPNNPVGHGIVRGNTTSQPMDNARIVLKKDGAGGWYVLTGFPEPK